MQNNHATCVVHYTKIQTLKEKERKKKINKWWRCWGCNLRLKYRSGIFILLILNACVPLHTGYKSISCKGHASFAWIQWVPRTSSTSSCTTSHNVWDCSTWDEGSWNRGKGKERYSRLSPLASIDLPGCTPHLPKSDPHSCHIPHSLFFLEWNMSKESQQSSSGSRSPQSASMPENKASLSF